MSDISLDLSVGVEGLSSVLKELKELNSTLETSKKQGEGLEKAGDKGGKGLKKIGDGAKQTKGGVDQLGNSLKSLMANPLVAAGAAIAAFVAAASKATEAINVQIKAERDLSFAVNNNSKLTTESAKNLAGYASELQGLTTFGDEYTMGLMKMGAQAGATEEDIKKMTKLALDISAQSGQDAKEVMKGLSLSYQDASKAMRVATQAGIAFTEEEKKKLAQLQATGKQAEANTLIYEKLNGAFGGAAEKDAQTFAGTIKQIQNILGDIGEEFGRIVMAFSKPVASGLKDVLQDVYNFLTAPEFVGAIQNIIAVVLTGFEALKTLFNAVWNVFKNFIGTIIDGFKNFIGNLSDASGGMDNLGRIAANVFSFLLGYITEAINALGAFGEVLMRVVMGDFEGAGKAAAKLGESISNMVDPKGMWKKAEEAGGLLVEKFKEIKTDVQKNWEFGGGDKGLPPPISNGTVSLNAANAKKIDADTAKTKKTMKDWLDELKKNALQVSESIASGLGGALNSIVKGTQALRAENQPTFEEYDAAIEATKAKWEEYNAAKEEGAEKTSTSHEAQMAFLQKEYAAADDVSKKAIKLKMDQLSAAKKKEKEESDATKKAAAEKAAAEKQKEKEIAAAEYAKAMAVFQNDVKNAETKHEQTKAEAAIGATMGVMQGALGFATAIAQLGPIVGLIMGAINMATVVGSVMGAVGQVKASASSLDSVKSNPPKAPSFRFGTMGYELPEGGEAVVGEAGPEVVSNTGGALQVESAYQTEQSGSAGGGGSVVINIYSTGDAELIDKITQTIQEVLPAEKSRMFNYAQ